jgi:hypothetical protein
MHAVPSVGDFVPSKHYFHTSNYTIGKEEGLFPFIMSWIYSVVYPKDTRESFLRLLSGRRVKLITYSHEVSNLGIFKILPSIYIFSF